MSLNLVKTTSAYDYEEGFAFLSYDNSEIIYDTGIMRRYNVSTGEEVDTFDYRALLTSYANPDTYNIADYATEADYILVISGIDNVAVVFDLSTKSVVYELTLTSTSYANPGNHSISEDGTRIGLLLAFNYEVYDIPTDTEIFDAQTALGGDAYNRCCTISGDGSTFLFVDDLNYCVVDLSTGNIINTRTEPTGNDPSAVSLSYDGSIASTSFDPATYSEPVYVDTWYTATSTLIDQESTNSIGIPNDFVALSPDASRIGVIFIGSFYYGEFWHAQTGSYNTQFGYVPVERYDTIHASADNTKMLISQNNVNRIEVWDVSGNSAIFDYDFSPYQFLDPTLLNISPDKQKLAFVDYYCVYVIDTSDFSIISSSYDRSLLDNRYPQGLGPGESSYCAFFDNGTKVLEGSFYYDWGFDEARNYLYAFDATTGATLYYFDVQLTTEAYDHAVCADTKNKMILQYTDYIEIYDLTDGSYLKQVTLGFTGTDNMIVGENGEYIYFITQVAIHRYHVDSEVIDTNYIVYTTDIYSSGGTFISLIYDTIVMFVRDDNYDSKILFFDMSTGAEDLVINIDGDNSDYNYACKYAGNISDNLAVFVSSFNYPYYYIIDVENKSILEKGSTNQPSGLSVVVSGTEWYDVNTSLHAIRELSIDLGKPTVEIETPTDIMKQV